VNNETSRPGNRRICVDRCQLSDEPRACNRQGSADAREARRQHAERARARHGLRRGPCELLATVATAAIDRGLGNIRTKQGAAESLPFDDGSFDWVISRLSAHHWHDVPQALAQVRRVLKPGGHALFIDIAGTDHPLLDTHLQAVEVLRDGSHIRDYRADEWLAFFERAGFVAKVRERWRMPIDFDAWVTRMRTPPLRVSAIRSLWENAPDEVRQYFAVQADGSFELDALMIEAH
jgi:SAM-dependent methyltransferase